MAVVPLPVQRARAFILVFGSSLLSGLAIVSFSASSRYLVDTLGLTSEAFGRIFLSQLVFAVLGGLLGGRLTKAIGPRATLGLVLLCQASAMASLWCATQIRDGYVLLLAATAVYGFSFGISGSPWSVYPPALFPRAKSSAIASVYTVFGVGLTLGPLFVRVCVSAGRWPLVPLSIGAGALTGVLLLRVTRMPTSDAEAEAPASRRPPPDRVGLSLFLAAALFYATIEASIGNWAVAFLTGEQGLLVEDAAIALACFFGTFTGARLVISFAIRRVAAAHIWTLLPIGMSLALLCLPLARTARTAWLLYAVAGLSCSGHFPLSMALSSTYFGPRASAQVSSWMFSALMVGIGLGAYFVGVVSAEHSMATAYRALVVSPVVLFVIAVALRSRIRRTSTPPSSHSAHVTERSSHV